MRHFYFFITIILSILSATYAEVKADDDQKIQHFDITTIAPLGKIGNVKTIDFNKDGLNDIFLNCHVISGNKPEDSYQKGVIILQKKGKPFSENPDFAWRIDPKATALHFGDFVRSDGVEIGYFTSEGFFAYCFTKTNDSTVKLISKKIIDDTSVFIHPAKYKLPLWQGQIDLDNNGYDDIIVPHTQGYTVYFQHSNREKFIPCILNAETQKDLKEISSSFITLKTSLPNIIIEDINNDGLYDIISLNKNELSYYLQKKDAPLSKKFTATPTGSSIIKALPTGSKPNELKRISLNLSDVNKDGVFDLIISIMRGSIDQISRLKTKVLIFWGRKSSNILYYPESPDQVVSLKGIVPLIKTSDVNSDGKSDLISASFQMTFSSNLQKLLLRYLKLTYRIQAYQSKKNKFSSNPDYERSINFPLQLIGKGSKYFSHIYFADFDGDKRPDLLTISGPSRKRGKVNIRLARKPTRHRNPLMISFYKDDYLLYRTKIPAEVKVSDINPDNKKDIIMQYRSRIVVMTSK